MLATNNDSVYSTAAELAIAGASVCIIDARESLTHPSVSHAAIDAVCKYIFEQHRLTFVAEEKSVV